MEIVLALIMELCILDWP